jgi:hypothetical protein
MDQATMTTDEKTRQRVLAYYRHLFPGLQSSDAATVEPCPVAALDPAFDLPSEAVGKGWTSQPEVLLLSSLPRT